jgi:hypothetical protein
MAATPQMTQQSLAQANSAARASILANGVPRLQNIYSQAAPVSPNLAPVTVACQNIGLMRGFLIRIKGTLQNTDGADLATLTGFGAANIVSNVGFQDFNNIQRVNTSGFHISMLNSAKQNMVFGGAYAPNVPVGFGNNWTVQAAPATIAHGATGDVTYFMYLPLAYSKNDLRGAVYAGLVNANAFLSLTLNNNPVQAAGSDPFGAVYVGAPGSWDGNVQIDIYQDYIDQLPMSNGSAVLPPLDMSTIYDLKFTTVGAAISTNTDYGIGYANYRTFLSTMLIIDNGGDFYTGSDVNYFSLVSANATNFWKYTPDVAALLARNIFMADPPPGVYWFDQRDRPINTNQYGQINLNINMNTVNANPKLVVGYEQFDLTATVSIMSSLPTG